MLNQMTMQGRISSDIRFSKNGDKEMGYFRIACNRDYKEKNKNTSKADYIMCKVFGSNVSVCKEYLKKGDMIIVSGRYKNDVPFKDDRGSVQYSSYIEISRIYMLPGQKDRQPTSTDGQPISFVQMDGVDF